ncbi:MAG TPA: hypothetical protein ACFYED_03495 [Candidatus Tripitaka californicus]|uniref:hypothetical protein n=1 Tax=Candidatus Tripitaka californicus TaxID=3367616 RepID=UPI0040281912
MDKKIVYLDQNVLSFIAKVKLGQIKEERVERLFSASGGLETLVKGGKIICPESVFHRIESGLGSDVLKIKLLETLRQLSQGISFRDWKELVDVQMQRAVEGFFGGRPSVLSRGEAFHDKTTWEDVLPLQELERLKRLYKERWEGLRKEAMGGYQRGLPELTNKLFRQHRERERQALVKGYLLQGDREPCLSTYVMEAYHLGGPRRNGLEGYKTRDPDLKRLAAFMDSGWLKAVPFVDVVSSLNAAILVYEEAREPEEGDFYDSLIVGTVLPYCDILVTDNFLKGILIKKMGFQVKYHVEVFSGKGSELEGLLACLEGLMVF